MVAQACPRGKGAAGWLVKVSGNFFGVMRAGMCGFRTIPRLPKGARLTYPHVCRAFHAGPHSTRLADLFTPFIQWEGAMRRIASITAGVVLAFASAAAHADTVTDWNETAIE